MGRGIEDTVWSRLTTIENDRQKAVENRFVTQTSLERTYEVKVDKEKLSVIGDLVLL